MAFLEIQPFQYVALRLPSDQVRVEQVLPNTQINLGKYGTFQTNQIIGRPYHLTFEIIDRSESKNGHSLRVVPAAELHAIALIEQAEVDEASTPATNGQDDGLTAKPNAKSNVNIHDNPTNQKLTMAEIEALKLSEMGSGKELVEKIMQSHSTLDQKTEFSLAKYSLRKHRKYLKRFTVLPLDVPTLANYIMAEKEFSRVLEMRNETIGLVGCWANVHAESQQRDTDICQEPSSRYLVVDDTGGLVVVALAERMGILHQSNLGQTQSVEEEEDGLDDEGEETEAALPHKPRRQQYQSSGMGAKSNSITVVHANQQPNLGLLRYFNFDPSNPTTSHPLYTNLKTISWLQLLDPESDTTYQEPERLSPEEVSKIKSNKRSAYYRKRRRWERVKNIVDETTAGGFNALVIASLTDIISILRHLVPLIVGGGQIVVYSPHIEPLVELADCYSTARRTAFLNTPEEDRIVPSKDFPVDPSQLLSPMVQTSSARQWQVLPGRTHPLMTARGGAEGYIFSATRVLPAEGKILARGRQSRSKKVKAEESAENVADTSEAEAEEPALKKQRLEVDDCLPIPEDSAMGGRSESSDMMAPHEQ